MRNIGWEMVLARSHRQKNDFDGNIAFQRLSVRNFVERKTDRCSIGARKDWIVPDCRSSTSVCSEVKFFTLYCTIDNGGTLGI